MRCLTLCVALLVLPAVFADEKADAKGVKTTTKDGKVSAVFPSKPTKQKVNGIEMDLLEAMDGKAMYMFSQNDLLVEEYLTDKASVKKRFKDGRDALLRHLEAKLVSEKDIKFGSLPGYTIDAKSDDGIWRSRHYLTKKSHVQIVVIGSKQFVDGLEASKFLDSLKIEE